MGLEHIEAALSQHATRGRAVGDDFDFICDAGSLQRLLATPYDADADWELAVHIRGTGKPGQEPLSIWLEGCSPVPLTGCLPGNARI